MRTRITRHTAFRLLIDGVEANGTFPKIYSIVIAETEPGIRDADWTAVISTPGLAQPGCELAFSAIAASVAERHSLIAE